MKNSVSYQTQDIDPAETQEWLEALQSVIREEGQDRALFLLETISNAARQQGIDLPSGRNTPYINTINTSFEKPLPPNAMAKRVRALLRWNAVAAVIRAGKQDSTLGGHIASYASAIELYEVGFEHFFHAATDDHGGDLLYIQGHCAPGIYARAYLEGRISEEQLDNFRQEVDGKGLSSYPHPWLMPNFWQFPTVSMGLGPLQAIYQARFLKYLHNRSLTNTENRHVWAFLGDGETDEPESLGAISLAARENLDNLIFVINCNLQRLDGPVRGNGKIIQELEAVFRGAGWNVIKVIWGSRWDPLLAADTKGLLRQRMEECVDGDYQSYKARDGAYVREHFFGKYPELKAMVAHMSDEEIWRLNRGGHDQQKMYAAYHEAVNHSGQPTVILAKTVKGYGMGSAGEGQNITHQQKKMTTEQLREFRDRFDIPINDNDLEKVPFFRPADDSPEIAYIRKQREALGGYLPSRTTECEKLTIPALAAFESVLTGSGDREMSTTMAFVRLLNILLKDQNIGKRVVPIVPDECRTFGMEGMFRQYGIYSSLGQLYTPEDAEQLMYYREAKDGVIFEEGITEPGAFCTWMAAASSYANNQLPMIPFYIYYSMFGFQRVGDLAWAAGDLQARGFLLGGTAGRTTLNGEGLQHQDGHAHILANTIPNCVTYDPTFAYELAVIIQDGLRRMYQEQENVYYYISVMNENYVQPAMPKDAEEGIRKGLYSLKKSSGKAKATVQLLGCGTILRECIAASEMLEKDFQVQADLWSATSFNELTRELQATERDNRLHPARKNKLAYVTECLEKTKGPIIASTDYVRTYAEGIRSGLPNKHYVVLGTDGFGRSDTREQLRAFFEVNRYHIAYAAIKALVDVGDLPESAAVDALKRYSIDANKPNPTLV